MLQQMSNNNSNVPYSVAALNTRNTATNAILARQPLVGGAPPPPPRHWNITPPPPYQQARPTIPNNISPADGLLATLLQQQQLQSSDPNPQGIPCWLS